MRLKKILSIAVIGSMVALSLVGCGKKANTPSSNKPNKSYAPGSLEDKMQNEGELNADDVQKAIEQGLIELD